MRSRNDSGVDAELIDAHAHLVPSSLIVEARKSGRHLGIEVQDTKEGPVLRFDGLPPLRPVSGSLASIQSRLDWMDRQGIGMQFVGPWMDIGGYTLTSENAAKWARLFNEHVVRATASFADRLKGLAMVPLQDAGLAVKEMEHAVRELRLPGVMLPTDPVDQDLARESFEPFWAAAEQLGVPVVLHPPTHGFGRTLRPEYLGFSLGRTLDTTITATKLILEGFLDRYPKLKMVLVHGGGYLPYQAERLSRAGQGGRSPAPRKLARGVPSAYLPLLYYDTVDMSAPAIRLLRDVVGAKHILLGSDFVFSGDEGSVTALVDRAGLSAQERAFICSGTAEELFLKKAIS